MKSRVQLVLCEWNVARTLSKNKLHLVSRKSFARTEKVNEQITMGI
jgi:hypothetical protein